MRLSFGMETKQLADAEAGSEDDSIDEILQMPVMALQSGSSKR